MKNIKEDFRWLLIFSLLVILITSIPYLIAYWRASNDWVFTGFVFGVEDGNSYIAKMLSGANGAWMFKSPYSAVPQQGLLAFIPYLLLGKLSSGPGQHAQLVALFQIYRWLAVLCLIFSTYGFTAQFIEKIFYRRAAVIIATVGGGLGWFSVFRLHNFFDVDLPLEFYSPETFGFLAILGLPHIVMARSLLMMGLTIYLNKEQTVQKSLVAGGLWFLVGIFQPITLVTGCAVIFFDSIFSFLHDIYSEKGKKDLSILFIFRRYRTPSIMLLFSLPWILYNLIAFRLDNYLAGWEQQNIITSPPIKDYLFSLWLIIILVIIGVYRAIKERRFREISLPVIWVILLPVLAYAPHNLQRRLVEGVWVSFSVLAVSILQQMFIKHSKNISFGFVLLSLLSSIIILAGVIQVSKTPDLPVYRPEEEVQAFEFLSNIANLGDVIIASYKTSNALPAWAPMTVIIGHGPESIRLDEFRMLINNFYNGKMSREEEQRFFETYSVDYIFYGPLEQQIGEIDPDQKPNLETVYQTDPYTIFRVRRNEQIP